MTYFENDLNLIFAEDDKKFLGVFKNDEYVVKRTYLEREKYQNRLYYTRIDPYGSPKAHICIIHGFAEHSGRYIDVINLIPCEISVIVINFFLMLNGNQNFLKNLIIGPGENII